jgi:predicted ester cyclase
MSLVEVEKKKTVVRQWIEQVFNAKQMESIDKLKVASYLDWTPLPGQRMDLPVSGIKQTVPTFMRSLPDFEFTEDSLFAESDLVVCVGHWSASHTGQPFLGLPAHGKTVGGSRIDMFRVVGDKMVEHWGCGNELRFLQLVGALPEWPPEGTAPPSDPRDVARQYVEQVIGRRNIAAVNSLVHIHAVDHTNHSLNMMFVLSGFPDYRVDVEEVLAEDDTVTVVSRYTGTHQGAFMGVGATGKTATGRRTDLFCVRDGRIVESWHDWSLSSLSTQIRN